VGPGLPQRLRGSKPCCWRRWPSRTRAGSWCSWTRSRPCGRYSPCSAPARRSRSGRAPRPSRRRHDRAARPQPGGREEDPDTRWQAHGAGTRHRQTGPARPEGNRRHRV